MNKKLFNLACQLERIIYEPLYDEDYLSKNKAWDYVNYSFKHFLMHLKEAHLILDKKKNLKFIDVGCGLGSKVLLASQFFDSYGIELNKEYHKVATDVNTPRRFLKYGRYETLQDKERVFNVNALTFDYKSYDVIYFFRPISKLKLQIKLEKQIFNTAKPGAIIIPIYSQSTFPNFIRHIPTKSNEIYMKIMKDEKAEKVIEKVKSQGI